MKKLLKLKQTFIPICLFFICLFFISILIILVGWLFLLIKVNTSLDIPDSLVAVLVGVSIFSLGQIFIRFIIEPFQNYNKLVGEISISLMYFSGISNVDVRQMLKLRELANAKRMPVQEKEIYIDRIKKDMTDKWDYVDLSRITLRKQASELLSITKTIPCYRFWSILKILPTQIDIMDTSRDLFYLSNVSTSYESGVIVRITKKRIAKTLKMETILKYLQD